MIKFKKSDVGDFFLNEAHPYSKTRTIKFQHVAVAIGGLALIVLMVGSVFDKRAQHEQEVAQAAKDAKNSSSVEGAQSGTKSQSAPNNQSAFISLQANTGVHSIGGSGRQFSASQIIQRGGSAADVLPIGTQIHVQLIGLVESMDANSPVTAVILEDALSPVQAMVIPKGTKVIGTGQLDSQRERLQVQFRTLVFPEGEQYSISAIATMPDGSSGLAGDFSSGEFKKNASQFIGNFVGGLAEGMKDRTAVGQLGIPLESGSIKNGVLGGIANTSLNYAKSSSEKMGQVSASIKVPSGTSFVLYLEKEFHQ